MKNKQLQISEHKMQKSQCKQREQRKNNHPSKEYLWTNITGLEIINQSMVTIYCVMYKFIECAEMNENKIMKPCPLLACSDES